jgi:hypothetical protein
MVEWLANRTGLPEELTSALIGAWVGVLRSEALHRAEQDMGFHKAPQSGEGTLRLDQQLVPVDWNTQRMFARIFHETGVAGEARSLLDMTAEKLREFEGQKAFEPVGWFTTSNNTHFLVTLWRDFLEPLSYEYRTQHT